jgi:hypothetical protein
MICLAHQHQEYAVDDTALPKPNVMVKAFWRKQNEYICTKGIYIVLMDKF